MEGALEDIRNAQSLLRHIPKGAEKALARAVNRTLTGTRAEAVRQVRGKFIVKAQTVRDTMEIRKASYTKPRGFLVSRGRPLSLTRFKVTPKAPKSTRGKSVQSRPRVRLSVTRGKQTTLQRAFLARMNSGVGLFQRKGRGRRAPIRKLYGPSVPQMLHHDRIAEEIETTTAERMKKELNHQISFLLEGGK
jgi:hypothetical protein